MAELVGKYHQQVKDGGTEDYLEARGISRRAIDRFQLGYTGDIDNRATANRLVIPYLTPLGPSQLKYRCITDHDCKELKHGKYVYDDGAQQLLYNAQTLLRAERVVVVEGELDAISVEMAGVPAVAFPGVDTWKKNRHWRWCFDSVAEVIVIADGDDPAKNPRDNGMGVGEEAARSVAESLRTALHDVDVRLHVMPVGHDANSFIHHYGTFEFLEQTGLI